MRKLVYKPPKDFVAEHTEFSRELRVYSIELTPGPAVPQSKSNARADYKVSRELGNVGTWTFNNSLNLGRKNGRWFVLWSPATLYPGLAEGGGFKLTQLQAASSTPVARDGTSLPDDSTAQEYLADIDTRFPTISDGNDQPGWAVDLQNPGKPAQRLKVLQNTSQAPRLRTTLDKNTQTAADRAIQNAPGPAALVAIKPSTGEILAIADRLDTGRGAFLNEYPPGSTFKVVTAAGLLDGGMRTTTTVGCPAKAIAAQRTITNHNNMDLGTVPLITAFDQSCNTTFATLGVAHLSKGGLEAEAKNLGFDLPIDPGTPAQRGSCPPAKSPNELAEDSFGQGVVTASPLNMALVAAAVEDGTWRSPRLIAPDRLQHRKTIPLAPDTADGLRSMMRAVVTKGTAANAGLPPGVAGKTGSAEDTSAGGTDAWFIGYRGDLAFAVLVVNGGEGGKVAAPIAAEFLH